MELLPNTMGVLLSKLRIKFQFQYIVQFTSPAMLDAVSNSVYYNTILKPKQVLCLEYLYLKHDVLCVLPTGYGKSLVFHLIPALMFAKAILKQDAGPSLWSALLIYRGSDFRTDYSKLGVLCAIVPVSTSTCHDSNCKPARPRVHQGLAVLKKL